MKVFDRLLLGASLVMVVAAMVLLVRKEASPQSGASPRELAEVRGLNLPTLSVGDSTAKALQMSGVAHVVYVFATTCGFCEQQRRHIADLLAALDTASVITASLEPTSVTHEYWAAIGASLREPEHLRPESAGVLALPGTPALVFVSPTGKVVSAYVGTVLSWDKERLRQELDRAGRSS